MTHFNLRRIALAGAASTVALVSAGAAQASAFYLQEQSVRAAGPRLFG